MKSCYLLLPIKTFSFLQTHHTRRTTSRLSLFSFHIRTVSQWYWGGTEEKVNCVNFGAMRTGSLLSSSEHYQYCLKSFENVHFAFIWTCSDVSLAMSFRDIRGEMSLDTATVGWFWDLETRLGSGPIGWRRSASADTASFKCFCAKGVKKWTQLTKLFSNRHC